MLLTKVGPASSHPHQEPPASATGNCQFAAVPSRQKNPWIVRFVNSIEFATRPPFCPVLQHHRSEDNIRLAVQGKETPFAWRPFPEADSHLRQDIGSQSPRASSRRRLRAALPPRLELVSQRIRSAKLLMTSRLLSVEPSFTMITSKSRKVCTKSESGASCKRLARL